MISAKEAMELVNKSDKKIQSILAQIESLIVKIAKEGKTSTVFENTSIQEMYVQSLGFVSVGFTELQKRVKEELEKLGYSMSIESYTYKVGGGFGNTDTPEEKTGYRIRVRW